MKIHHVQFFEIFFYCLYNMRPRVSYCLFVLLYVVPLFKIILCILHVGDVGPFNEFDAIINTNCFRCRLKYFN